LNGVYENDCWASYGDISPRKKISNPHDSNKPELTKDGEKFYLEDMNAEKYFSNVTRNLYYFMIPYLIFILIVFIDEILGFIFKGNKGFLRLIKIVGFYSNILFIITALSLMIYRYQFKVQICLCDLKQDYIKQLDLREISNKAYRDSKDPNPKKDLIYDYS
jgi:hypothetical protein